MLSASVLLKQILHQGYYVAVSLSEFRYLQALKGHSILYFALTIKE